MPLLISEPGTPIATTLWRSAERVVSCRVVFAEASAALAQAVRLSRLDLDAHRPALSMLDELYDALDLVQVTDALVRRARALARTFALRGYDAMHCAAAELLPEPDLVAAAGDAALLNAWVELGLATADTSPA